MAKAFGAARFGGGSVDEDTGIGSDEDFVELIPPPAEKYDPEWRLKPAEFPPRLERLIAKVPFNKYTFMLLVDLVLRDN